MAQSAFSRYEKQPIPAGNSAFPMSRAATPLAGMHPTGITGAAPLVDLYTGRWAQAKAHQQIYEPDWMRFWKWYMAWRQELSDPVDWWRSNEVIPTLFKMIETLVPRTVLSLIGQPEYFRIKGIEANDELHELAIETLLKVKLEKMQFIQNAIEAIKYMWVCGHVWGKMVWDEEWRNRQIIQPIIQTDPTTGMPTGVGMQKSKLTEKVFDGPRFSYVTLDRLKADPSGKGRWYIEEIDMALSELVELDKRLGGVYQNLDQLSVQTTSGVIAQSDYQEPQATLGIPQQYVTVADGPIVRLWQCWGWIPPELRAADGEEWRLTVIANRNIVLRDVPAPTPDGKPPYWPIKCIPIPNRLYGETPMRWVGPMADQQTRLANHRLDEVMLNVWQQYVYDRTCNILDNEMLFQPGGAIGLDTGGRPVDQLFRVLERRPTSPEAWKEDDYRQTQIEVCSGATDLAQGLNESDRPTTGDTSMRLQQGSMRFQMQNLWHGETFLKEVLRRAYELLQQRMPEDEIVRVLSSDGSEWDVTLDLQALQIPVDIQIGVGIMQMSRTDKVALLQQVVGLGQSPTFAPYIRPGILLTDILKESGLQGAARYVKSDMEVMLATMGGMAPQGTGSGVAAPEAPSPSDQGGAPMSMPQGGGGTGGP